MSKYTEYLYQALHSEHGIRLTTDDPKFLRTKLYEARREAADAALDQLSVVFAPGNPIELWIVKR